MSLHEASLIKHKRNRPERLTPSKPTQAPFTDAERQMLRGRPTDYYPALAQDVIEKMSDGYSVGGFAGQIGVARRTINRWMDQHEEFRQACERAMAVRQHWWETKAIEVATTGGQGSQGQMVIFGLINAGREDWKQKQEIEHTGQVTLATLVETSMRAIEGQLVDVTPRLEQPVSTPLEDDLFS